MILLEFHQELFRIQDLRLQGKVRLSLSGFAQGTFEFINFLGTAGLILLKCRNDLFLI